MSNTRKKVDLRNQAEAELHKMSATLELHQELSDLARRSHELIAQHNPGTSPHRIAQARYAAHRLCESIAWEKHTDHFNAYQKAKTSLNGLEETD